MDGRGRAPQIVSGRTLSGRIDSLLTECDPPPRLLRLETDFRNFEPFRSDGALAPIVHQAASSQRDGVLRLEGIKYGFFAPRLVRPPAQWEPECPAHAQASAFEPHSVLRVAVAPATPHFVQPCLRMRSLSCPPAVGFTMRCRNSARRSASPTPSRCAMTRRGSRSTTPVHSIRVHRRHRTWSATDGSCRHAGCQQGR